MLVEHMLCLVKAIELGSGEGSNLVNLMLVGSTGEGVL